MVVKIAVIILAYHSVSVPEHEVMGGLGIHRKADAVGDKHDGADCLGTSAPGQHALARSIRRVAAGPRAFNRIISCGSSKRLKQSHGVAWIENEWPCLT